MILLQAFSLYPRFVLNVSTIVSRVHCHLPSFVISFLAQVHNNIPIFSDLAVHFELLSTNFLSINSLYSSEHEHYYRSSAQDPQYAHIRRNLPSWLRLTKRKFLILLKYVEFPERKHYGFSIHATWMKQWPLNVF